MDVGVCGFGFSGSGAVLDLLKEYKEVFVADKTELSFIYKPDGLNDLYYNICLNPSRYFSSDSSIRRFIQFMERSRKKYNRLTNGAFDRLLDNFLEDIIDVRWKGSTSVHLYQDKGLSYVFLQRMARAIRKRYEKKMGPLNRHLAPEIKMYYSSISEEEYFRSAGAFVTGMIGAMEGGDRAMIRAIDQAFSANNPRASFHYFTRPKAIIVLRDPRDIYLLAKCTLGLSGSFIPTDNVSGFIRYYKGLLDSNAKMSNDEDILTMNFEELIYDNEMARKKIEDFLGIKDRTGKRIFKPEISINNTQLWLKYPNYAEDIKEIENQMGEYLYPFEKFAVKPLFNVKSF